MSSPRTKYIFFFLIYPCCPAQTLQTTPVNTSTGLLLPGFIPPEQSLHCPPQGWLRPAGQQPLQPGRGALRGQRYRLSAAAAKFPRASRWSPSPPREADGSHTHLSWPAWSWGSACSRLGAARSLSARPRPPPRASPLSAPALARGRRFTRGWINPNALFIRPRINSHPNWALSVSVISADRSPARRHEGWPRLPALIGHAAVWSMCRSQGAALRAAASSAGVRSTDALARQGSDQELELI